MPRFLLQARSFIPELHRALANGQLKHCREMEASATIVTTAER